MNDLETFEMLKQQREVQAYCTCNECIEGYISPRMKWFLLRYAEIYEVLLPRSLSIFEGTATQDRTFEPDFLDLDVYSDLDHMPVALRRAVTTDLRVMSGYCEVFGRIIECLKQNCAPTASLLNSRISYTWGSKSEDARIFLLAGGNSTYALKYLIGTLKDLMIVRNGSRLSRGGLASLPICLNDTAYDLVREKLVEQ